MCSSVEHFEETLFLSDSWWSSTCTGKNKTRYRGPVLVTRWRVKLQITDPHMVTETTPCQSKRLLTWELKAGVEHYSNLRFHNAWMCVRSFNPLSFSAPVGLKGGFGKFVTHSLMEDNSCRHLDSQSLQRHRHFLNHSCSIIHFLRVSPQDG